MSEHAGESLPDHVMHCMEVWGGNQAFDGGVTMAGVDAWVYSRPFGEHAGGGDVHYVSSCATGRITRLLVADVSGHGDAVAAIGTALRDGMRRYVNHIDQTRFVRALDRALSGERGGIFATAAVLTLFAPTNDLFLSSAGHPAPLLYRSRERSWTLLRPDRDAGRATRTEEGAAARGGLANVPLGIVEDARFDEVRYRLRVGDLVLCYTDSLIEARRSDGSMLGEAGLVEIVARLDPLAPARLIPALLAALRAENPANLAGDDVTALLFRPNGMLPRVPLRDRILAPMRILRSALGALRPGGAPAGWPELSVAAIGGALFAPLNRVGWREKQPRSSAPK